MGDDRPGDLQVLVKRLGLEHQHVGSRRERIVWCTRTEKLRAFALIECASRHDRFARCYGPADGGDGMCGIEFVGQRADSDAGRSADRLPSSCR